MSSPTTLWFTMFAAVGFVSAMFAAAVFWLILTRPLLVVQNIAGLL